MASDLRITVLGAAAGGGLPQWNCACEVCRRAWTGDGVRPQTQSSIAVSADGRHWTVFNGSPDLRQQILQTPALHPRDAAEHGRRNSPIASVVLTNADIDHIAGLLILREKQRFSIFGTARVLAVLAANPVFRALDPDYVRRVALVLDAPAEVAPGLEVELFTVPGKVALYLEEDARAAEGRLVTDQETEDTVGARIRATASGAEFFYVPGCARLSERLAARLRGAALVLFDGTVWHDAEMSERGVGAKTGSRMGHMAMDGPAGTMAAFAGLEVRRKVFIHINNTNPVLVPGSPERLQVEGAGWEIAEDGMEMSL